MRSQASSACAPLSLTLPTSAAFRNPTSLSSLCIWDHSSSCISHASEIVCVFFFLSLAYFTSVSRMSIHEVQGFSFLRLDGLPRWQLEHALYQPDWQSTWSLFSYLHQCRQSCEELWGRYFMRWWFHLFLVSTVEFLGPVYLLLELLPMMAETTSHLSTSHSLRVVVCFVLFSTNIQCNK